MKRVRSTNLVISIFAVTGFAAGQPVSAGVEAECRQEAEDFGIMPELHEDYISGCIDSRGGMATPASAKEDYVPPSESDDINTLGTGSENVVE